MGILNKRMGKAMFRVESQVTGTSVYFFLVLMLSQILSDARGPFYYIAHQVALQVKQHTGTWYW